tara:strand:+ start:4093 stop:4938 length:846 start_codon:yes stop_codon:yes gene_type:complete
MEVIGIGNAGREICKLFKDKGYNTYSIDTHSNAFVKFPKVRTIEEAEKVQIDLTELKNNVKSDEILCIMAGSGLITGACLKILENFKDKQINFLYIQPDTSFMNNSGKTRERVIRNILQEFARSGLFNKIWMVSNKNISNLSSDISIDNYFEKINEKILDIWLQMRYYNKATALMGNMEEPQEQNRIATFGLYNLSDEAEQKFYELDKVREKHFYFIFSEETLKETGNVLDLVSRKLEKARDDEFQEVSYGFFSSRFSVDKVYIMYYTNHIQSETGKRSVL